MKPPKKGDKPIIDRSRYQAELSRPLAYGNNVVATDTIGLSPQAVQGFGLQYYGGSLKDKDIIYKKGDSYYIYNEQPEGEKTIYGLVEVGNPFRANTSASASPPVSKIVDPMKVPGYNGMLPPVVERYYKGGVVKKYNGYNVGGDVNTLLGATGGLAPALASDLGDKSKYDYDFKKLEGTNPAASQLAGLANLALPGVGTAAQGVYAAKDTLTDNFTKIDNSTGKFKDKEKAIAAGIGNSLFKTTPIGMLGTAFDKEKTLGEKALSLGSFGLTDVVNFEDAWDAVNSGSLKDRATGLTNLFRSGNILKGKADIESLEKENQELIEQKKKEEREAKQRSRHKASLEEQFAARLNKGGEVKGKGTSTSDSIKAKVEPGSFVVPAKNADKAEMIRATVLKKAPKRAKLNQSGGVDVRLSDGEHLFSPEERMEIEAAGIDLTQLAPEAQSSLSEHLKCGGKVKMWKGGKVMGYADGGGIGDKEKAALYDAIYGPSDLPVSRKAKLYDTVFGELPKKDRPKIKDGKVELSEAAKEVIPGKENYIVDPSSVPSAAEIEAFKNSQAAKPSARKAPKRTPVKTQTREPNGLTVEQMSKLTPKNGEPTGPVVPQTNLANAGTTISTTGGINYDPLSTNTGSQTVNKTTGTNFPIGLDQAIGYALPAFQLAMGAKALKDAGPRPKDQLDPDYLDAIAKARKNLDLANAEAKFGFTPEEFYSINQSNTGAYRDARTAAQNFSGGSASNAYSMDRRNVNDFFTRGLEARINDRKLQLAKREMANEQQRYVDNLVAGKANMNRNLFQDDMNAWQQNQSAGASLLGAGLSNAIGASRYSQELNYMKERDKKYGVNY